MHGCATSRGRDGGGSQAVGRAAPLVRCRTGRCPAPRAGPTVAQGIARLGALLRAALPGDRRGDTPRAGQGCRSASNGASQRPRDRGKTINVAFGPSQQCGSGCPLRHRIAHYNLPSQPGGCAPALRRRRASVDGSRGCVAAWPKGTAEAPSTPHPPVPPTQTSTLPVRRLIRRPSGWRGAAGARKRPFWAVVSRRAGMRLAMGC